MAVEVAILSCHFQAVIRWLASPILKEFQSQYGADQDLKVLGRKLRKIKAVFNDADHKQTEDEEVKEWFVDVRDLVYDAEDILDLYATEVGRWNQQVLNSSHASSSSTNLTKLKNKFDIGSPLKEIIVKSEDLVKQIDDLCLKADVVGRPVTEIGGRGRETSSLLSDESRIYGRESDKNKIVELLLSHEPNVGDNVGVLPVVGMGGLGKTTLAQLVYNDKKVEKHFDIKAWVCVSEEVDVGKITKDILESVTKDVCHLLKLDSLQGRLKDLLMEKRFLIVLDDIWNKNPDDWETLRIPFRFGKEGSKIMVTTRSEVVSKIMGTIPTYFLGVLLNDDCWELFKQRAAVNDEYLHAHPNLEAIGKAIVRKCNGLPLAAKALGSLLRFKVDEDEWKDVMETDLWNISEGENNVLPILKLSYQHLPSHLKQCFAYCSIFPKDHEFDKEELVWMWMAEGFVQSIGRKQLEDVGSSYFDDLLSRSFFQYSKDDVDGKPVFVMHDLVHDLAQSISRETCIALNGGKLCNISDKARYSSLAYGRRQAVKFDVFYDAKRLRTFLLRFPFDTVIEKFPHDLFPAWRCLRVLYLRNLLFEELPDSIGNLNLLRYLDLGDTYIQTLPESVCNLYNLQTLILGYYIIELPENLCNLINLHCINIDSYYIRLRKMSRGIGTLTNLQTLSNFVVGESDGTARLGELKDLIHLRGRLCISQLQNVVNVMDAKEANLENKQHLCKLIFEWSRYEGDLDLREEKRVVAKEIIECLQPHEKLKELSIHNYPCICFPSWIPMLSGLVKLNLKWCKEVQVLPPLGQLPFLKYLYIFCIKNVKHMGGYDFYGDGMIKGFPSLEKLELINMDELEEWSARVEDSEEENGKESFPCLANLAIFNCPKLSGLPFYRLPSLVDLTIELCMELTTIQRLRIPSHVGGDGEEFPCLRNLKIINCPKLRQLPHRLPSLVELQITKCRQMGALPTLPLLRRLHLYDCEGKTLFMRVGPLPSLSYLFISSVRRLKCLTEFLQPLTSLEELEIYACKDLKNEVLDLHHLTSLQKVKIHRCGKLILTFSKEGEQFPTKIQSLSLRPSNKHKILHQLHNLTSLVELEIRLAPQLVSFQEAGLPPKLRRFEIHECKNLESLPKGLCNLTCLEELKIKMAPRLASFPETGLPSKLQILEIIQCKSLKFIPKGLRNITCLEELTINKCPSLTSFTTVEDEEGGLLPPTLKSIHIQSCRNLKELSRREWINHNFTSLGDSTIEGYHNTTALKEIWIQNCKNLESLPARMQNLTSLEKLSIMRCHRLVTFPEGGLPTKLREVEISGCGDFLDSLPKCVGLHKLTSLKKLTFSLFADLVSFPKEDDGEEWQLPPILGKLSFKNFESLEFFGPKWLYNLTSLDTLQISHASKLSSLPEQGPPTSLRKLYFECLDSIEFLPPKWLQNLTSLQVLYICDVPKLASFPEKQLPTTLQYLRIIACPLLKESCVKENGRDWPKIAHIRDIVID